MWTRRAALMMAAQEVPEFICANTVHREVVVQSRGTPNATPGGDQTLRGISAMLRERLCTSPRSPRRFSDALSVLWGMSNAADSALSVPRALPPLCRKNSSTMASDLAMRGGLDGAFFTFTR